MIILYDKFKTSGFDRNDLVLRNATKCEVTWEKNGQYQIDLIYPIVAEDNAWKSIVKGAIVKCPVPHQQDQLFRLNTPTKKMDENGTYFYIEATGYHITYDLSYNFLVDTEISSKTGIEAGEYILSNTQYTHEFSWLGDISTVGTAYYVRQNPIDALIGSEDNAYVNVWGGELVRDNFTIGMFNKAGENRGVSIIYSKNITGFEQAADDSNLITRAMPYITDDSSSSDSSNSNSDSTTIITLPEQFIDSPKIEDYANIYVKDVEVTLTDDQKNYTTEQKYEVMRDYVNNMYENQNIDIPMYSYTLDFVELCKTEEYKNFAVLEEVHPYDFIVVKALDVDVIAELVGYKYDSIAQLYEEVTLGNVKNDIIRSNQKSLFQLTQQNQNTIKILQAQMGDIPERILNIASTTTSGGNNLFDHSVLDNQYASEWSTSGNANIVSDATLHDTDKVFEMPPGTSVSKNDILLNPNNYYGQQLVFSLQAKYSGLTVIDSGQGSYKQTNVLLGALDAIVQRCLVDTTGTSWVPNSSNTGLVSEKVAVTGGTAITVTNSSSYSYNIHAWDNQGNQLTDFTTGSIPSSAFYIQVELSTNVIPTSLTGFNIFETNPYTSQGIATVYASSAESDWSVQEQSFYLQTEHPSDIIKQVNFRANNGDSNGTAYIAAFMINTGSVRSDYSQSSNDTVETLRAHQAVFDSLSATYATIENLNATNATINNLSSTYATITNLNAANANINNLKASVGNVIDLTAGTLKAGSVTATNIQTATITASSGIIANGAITTAMIGTGAVNTAQIADGSITDAKIVGLTANKITAGTIDASQITVTNLNAANITVGTINGQQIAPGAITATQLANGAVGTSQLSSGVNSTIQSAISEATTANTNASTALTAANGKNKNYYSSTAPTRGTYNTGDLWFNTANGNQISQWNGSAWLVTQLGSAALTSLDAGVITTGTLDANRIGANTITVDKILIGDFTNLIPDDPGFENGGINWSISDSVSGNYYHTGSKSLHMVGNGTIRDTSSIRAIPCQAGDQFYAECWVMSPNPASSGTVGLESTLTGSGVSTTWPSFQDVTTTALSSTWIKISGIITIPSGYTSIYIRASVRNNVSSGDYYFDDFICRKVNPSVLIQDGAITTSKIVSSAITTDKIAVGAVQASNIAANTITAIQIASNTITSTQIASRTITADRIVAGAITANEIAASTITGNKIAANTISGGNIVAGTITSTQIATGTITAGNIVSGTITSSSACIASLNATWLTTGTLNASLVNVTNINASNITTGTLSASRIDTSNLTAAKISTQGSNVYGTIGSWTENNYTCSGFLLRDTSGNDLYRLASGNIGDDGNPATIIDVNGALSIRSTISGTYGASLELFNDFEIATQRQNGQTATFQLSTDSLVISQNDWTNSRFWNYKIDYKYSSPAGTVLSYYLLLGESTLYSITPQVSSSSPWFRFNLTSGVQYGVNAWQSDISLKTNIQDSTEDALSKICSIPMRSFTWKQNGETQKLGLISQEAMAVEETFAFGVQQQDGRTIYQPDTSILIPYMIKSIQQLNDKITDLENEVEALKSEKAS